AHETPREPQSRAANTLVLPEPAALGVADGAVRDQELVRGECARIVFLDRGFGAKERDLKSQRIALRGGEPARHIPPLGAKLRVTAVVRRKLQRMTGNDGCIGGRCGKP